MARRIVVEICVEQTCRGARRMLHGRSYAAPVQ